MVEKKILPRLLKKRKKIIFIFMDFSCRCLCFKAHAFDVVYTKKKTIVSDNEKYERTRSSFFFFRFDSFFLVNECSSLIIFLFLLIFRPSSSSYSTALALRFLLIHSRKKSFAFCLPSLFKYEWKILLFILHCRCYCCFHFFPYFSVEFFFMSSFY